MRAGVVGLVEMAEYFLDDGEGWVDPEMLASQVSVENAVHLRAERVELRIVAHHVGAAVKREAVAFEPVLLEVAV